MGGAPPAIRAIGAFAALGALAGGGWIGFRQSDAGYDLVVESGGVISSQPAAEDELLALAIAYFEEAIDAPPSDLAATHADLSDLVRFVAKTEADPERRARLNEAVDAIDDGLAGDAVAARLATCRRVGNEQADPVDLLVTRARELVAGP